MGLSSSRPVHSHYLFVPVDGIWQHVSPVLSALTNRHVNQVPCYQARDITRYVFSPVQTSIFQGQTNRQAEQKAREELDVWNRELHEIEQRSPPDVSAISSDSEDDDDDGMRTRPHAKSRLDFTANRHVIEMGDETNSHHTDGQQRQKKFLSSQKRMSTISKMATQKPQETPQPEDPYRQTYIATQLFKDPTLPTAKDLSNPGRGIRTMKPSTNRLSEMHLWSNQEFLEHYQFSDINQNLGQFSTTIYFNQRVNKPDLQPNNYFVTLQHFPEYNIPLIPFLIFVLDLTDYNSIQLFKIWLHAHIDLTSMQSITALDKAEIHIFTFSSNLDSHLTSIMDLTLYANQIGILTEVLNFIPISLPNQQNSVENICQIFEKIVLKYLLSTFYPKKYGNLSSTLSLHSDIQPVYPLSPIDSSREGIGARNNGHDMINFFMHLATYYQKQQQLQAAVSENTTTMQHQQQYLSSFWSSPSPSSPSSPQQPQFNQIMNQFNNISSKLLRLGTTFTPQTTFSQFMSTLLQTSLLPTIPYIPQQRYYTKSPPHLNAFKNTLPPDYFNNNFTALVHHITEDVPHNTSYYTMFHILDLLVAAPSVSSSQFRYIIEVELVDGPGIKNCDKKDSSSSSASSSSSSAQSKLSNIPTLSYTPHSISLDLPYKDGQVYPIDENGGDIPIKSLRSSFRGSSRASNTTPNVVPHSPKANSNINAIPTISLSGGGSNASGNNQSGGGNPLSPSHPSSSLSSSVIQEQCYYSQQITPERLSITSNYLNSLRNVTGISQNIPFSLSYGPQFLSYLLSPRPDWVEDVNNNDHNGYNGGNIQSNMINLNKSNQNNGYNGQNNNGQNNPNNRNYKYKIQLNDIYQSPTPPPVQKQFNTAGDQNNISGDGDSGDNEDKPPVVVIPTLPILHHVKDLPQYNSSFNQFVAGQYPNLAPLSWSKRLTISGDEQQDRPSWPKGINPDANDMTSNQNDQQLVSNPDKNINTQVLSAPTQQSTQTATAATTTPTYVLRYTIKSYSVNDLLKDHSCNVNRRQRNYLRLPPPTSVGSIGFDKLTKNAIKLQKYNELCQKDLDRITKQSNSSTNDALLSRSSSSSSPSLSKRQNNDNDSDSLVGINDKEDIQDLIQNTDFYDHLAFPRTLKLEHSEDFVPESSNYFGSIRFNPNSVQNINKNQCIGDDNVDGSIEINKITTTTSVLPSTTTTIIDSSNFSDSNLIIPYLTSPAVDLSFVPPPDLDYDYRIRTHDDDEDNTKDGNETFLPVVPHTYRNNSMKLVTKPDSALPPVTVVTVGPSQTTVSQIYPVPKGLKIVAQRHIPPGSQVPHPNAPPLANQPILPTQAQTQAQTQQQILQDLAPPTPPTPLIIATPQTTIETANGEINGSELRPSQKNIINKLKLSHNYHITPHLQSGPIQLYISRANSELTRYLNQFHSRICLFHQNRYLPFDNILSGAQQTRNQPPGGVLAGPNSVWVLPPGVRAPAAKIEIPTYHLSLTKAIKAIKKPIFPYELLKQQDSTTDGGNLNNVDNNQHQLQQQQQSLVVGHNHHHNQSISIPSIHNPYKSISRNGRYVPLSNTIFIEQFTNFLRNTDLPSNNIQLSTIPIHVIMINHLLSNQVTGPREQHWYFQDQNNDINANDDKNDDENGDIDSSNDPNGTDTTTTTTTTTTNTTPTQDVDDTTTSLSTKSTKMTNPILPDGLCIPTLQTPSHLGYTDSQSSLTRMSPDTYNIAIYEPKPPSSPPNATTQDGNDTTQQHQQQSQPPQGRPISSFSKTAPSSSANSGSSATLSVPEPYNQTEFHKLVPELVNVLQNTHNIPTQQITAMWNFHYVHIDQFGALYHEIERFSVLNKVHQVYSNIFQSNYSVRL